MSTSFEIGEIVLLDDAGRCVVIARKTDLYDVVLVPNGVISHGIEEKRLTHGPHAAEYRADNVRLRDERHAARELLGAKPNETLAIAAERVVGTCIQAQRRLKESLSEVAEVRRDLREALNALGAHAGESAAEAARRIVFKRGGVERCGQLEKRNAELSADLAALRDISRRETGYMEEVRDRLTRQLRAEKKLRAEDLAALASVRAELGDLRATVQTDLAKLGEKIRGSK